VRDVVAFVLELPDRRHLALDVGEVLEQRESRRAPRHRGSAWASKSSKNASDFGNQFFQHAAFTRLL